MTFIKNNILNNLLEYTYDDNIGIQNLLISVKFVWYINKKDTTLEKILRITHPNIELPIFFKKIDEEIEIYKDNKFLIYPLKKTQKSLQDSPVSWIYYALYFALNLKTHTINSFVENKEIQQITSIVIKFHYAYLNYKEEEKKKNIAIKNNKQFFKECSRTILRTIEYLVKFEQYNSEYLNKMYFETAKDDIEINFLLQASEIESTEADCFLIKYDRIKAVNYLVYENTDQDIFIQVESSKKINKGTDTSDTEQNHKISKYFADGFEQYAKLLNIEFKKKIGTGGGGKREIGGLQYTEEEELLRTVYISKNTTSTFLTPEDKETVKVNEKMKKRAFPSNDLESGIPNLYKQRLRNKAFSANITKKSMLLSSDYKIPPIKIFKDFLEYFFKQELSNELDIIDVYKIIFLFDTISGLGYRSIIELLLEQPKTIKLDSNTITITINQSLFAKNKNKFIKNSEKKINYKIPHNLVYLLNRAKSFFSELSDENQVIHLNDDYAKEYYDYVKSIIKEYPKSIVFDPKSMWRLIDSYRKSLYYEDMSTLFCMGRNQQNDTPKLAYASTNKHAQNHSKLLERIYIDLGIHEITAFLLQIDKSIFKPKIEFNKSNIYVGSSQAVKPEESKSFFLKLKKLILNETDDEIYFNLVALYVRYSLSLLVGTRGYDNSASLEKFSFEMDILLISEKADTLISGIRIIPLCKEIKNLIKKYKVLCKNYNIVDNNIYLIQNKKPKIFKKNIALEILKSYQVDSNLIEFVTFVPLNTGRHVFTKIAMETNFNVHYIEAYLGHYMAGGEHQGIYSTLNMHDYNINVKKLTSNIASIYGVLPL